MQNAVIASTDLMDRFQSLQILIILLTGKSTDDISVPSDQIKKSGISKVIVVGIGRVPSDDLKSTASNPQNALICPSYPQLPEKVPDVIALINAGSYNLLLENISYTIFYNLTSPL